MVNKEYADKDFIQISLIRDEMISSPEVESLLIWNAAKLALEDTYLYDLFIDWAKETDVVAKTEMLNEVTTYAYEVIRKFGMNNESI